MSLENEEIIVLLDEDNNELEFELFEIFEVNGAEYAFLVPIDEGLEPYIMKIVQGEDGEDILVEIDNDEEWERVVEAWEEYISDWDEE